VNVGTLQGFVDLFEGDVDYPAVCRSKRDWIRRMVVWLKCLLGSVIRCCGAAGRADINRIFSRQDYDKRWCCWPGFHGRSHFSACRSCRCPHARGRRSRNERRKADFCPAATSTWDLGVLDLKDVRIVGSAEELIGMPDGRCGGMSACHFSAPKVRDHGA